MQTILKQPLTNVQLELLKTFSHQLSTKDILDLKKNLAVFFSNKLIKEADKNFDESQIDNLLIAKLRKSK